MMKDSSSSGQEERKDRTGHPREEQDKKIEVRYPQEGFVRKKSSRKSHYQRKNEVELKVREDFFIV